MPTPDPTQPAPAPAPFWDAEHHVTSVAKSDVSEYRVGYARKGKREYVTLRYWYWDELGKAWKPTKNGTNIDLALAADFVEAIIQAATWGNDNGGL